MVDRWTQGWAQCQREREGVMWVEQVDGGNLHDYTPSAPLPSAPVDNETSLVNIKNIAASMGWTLGESGCVEQETLRGGAISRKTHENIFTKKQIQLLWPRKQQILLICTFTHEHDLDLFITSPLFPCKRSVRGDLPRRWSWKRRADISRISSRPALCSWCHLVSSDFSNLQLLLWKSSISSSSSSSVSSSCSCTSKPMHWCGGATTSQQTNTCAHAAARTGWWAVVCTPPGPAPPCVRVRACVCTARYPRRVIRDSEGPSKEEEEEEVLGVSLDEIKIRLIIGVISPQEV